MPSPRLRIRSGQIRLVLVLLLLASGCTPEKPAASPQSTVLRIAAAGDLKFAFEDLKQTFQQANPEIVLEPTFGASGTFFAQISQNAPFDLFLSADENYPKQLAEKGKVRGSPFRYAAGHLVLWIANDSPLNINDLGLKVLAEDRVKKIAIANPKTAPYGRAAEESLRHAELWSALESKIVLGENAAQATQFAESGNVDAALIPLSLALSKTMQAKGKYWIVPEEFHRKIIQAGVILNPCKHPEAAIAFQEFLTSLPGRKILEKYGLQREGE